MQKDVFFCAEHGHVARFVHWVFVFEHFQQAQNAPALALGDCVQHFCFPPPVGNHVARVEGACKRGELTLVRRQALTFAILRHFGLERARVEVRVVRR